MKKYLALAILTGALLGAGSLYQQGVAVPFSPSVMTSPAAGPTGGQILANGPQDGWEVPNVTSDNKRSVVDDGKPVIQVALLLDTSGSMDPLIDQAKTELWSIVNKLGKARYKGQQPTIEVALYEYGKSSLSSGQGYIQQLSPFTHDLDGLSETLFALQTNGGEEYCSWAIRSALEGLSWKKREGSLRMIFIAGNEPFNQGPVQPTTAFAQASEDGVLVYPILCAAGSYGDRDSWVQAATLAHTDLKVIDHTKTVSIPKTPYDEKLAKLGENLNSTYVAYGEIGQAKAARQIAQDSNMAKVSEAAMAERSVSKASMSYRNEEWDIVDRYKAGGASAPLPEAELPAQMKGMSPKEQEAYVTGLSEKRETIQKDIRDLSVKREAYLAQYRTKSASSDETLGQAVIESIKDRAKAAGFTF